MADLTNKEMLEVIDARIDQLWETITGWEKEAHRLNELGVTQAKEHWPSDKPGALVLLYSMQSDYYEETGKRREYIGKKPEKIAEAKARLARYDELQELLKKIRRYKLHVDNLQSGIERLYQKTQNDPMKDWW